MKKKTILIVDDDYIIREVLESMVTLYHPDAVIIHAKHGADAWETINSPENGHIDLMISDVRMPIMNGIQLVEKVKRDFPHIHVILMSGESEPEEHEGDAFIAKPFGMSDVMELIKGLMVKQ